MTDQSIFVKAQNHGGIGVFAKEEIQKDQTFYTEQPRIQLNLISWYNKFPARLELFLHDERFHDALIFALTIYPHSQVNKDILERLHPRDKNSHLVDEYIRFLPSISNVIAKDPELKLLLNRRMEFRHIPSIAQLCAKVQMIYFVFQDSIRHETILNLAKMAVCLNHSCNPNTVVIVNGTRDTVLITLVAKCEIHKDEECSISYLGENDLRQSTEQRNKKLKNGWGIDQCNCIRCQNE